jgi:hypothetical protein
MTLFSSFSSLLFSFLLFSFCSCRLPSSSIVSELPKLHAGQSIVYHNEPLESTIALGNKLGVSHSYITPELRNLPVPSSAGYLLSSSHSPATFGFNSSDALVYRWLTVVSYTESPYDILGWNCSSCSAPLISSFDCTHVIINKDTETLAFVGSDPVSQRIMAVYRGSDNVVNWILDFEAWHIDAPLDGIPGAYTAQGFFTCFQALRDPVYNAILYNINKHPEWQITIIGHSLGGAIASITSLDFAYNAHLSVETFSFGSPRAGDSGYAKAYEQLVQNYWRMVKGRDPVPHLPLEIMGFQHIGHEVWQENGVYHVCNWDENEDPNCSDSDHDWLLNFRASDHTSYMNITQ